MRALLFLMLVFILVGIVVVFIVEFIRRRAYRTEELFKVLVDGVVLAVEEQKLESLYRHHCPKTAPVHAELERDILNFFLVPNREQHVVRGVVANHVLGHFPRLYA